MIPTWAVFVIVVVIVLVYFLLSNTARQRRLESVGGDFASIPDFHANQVFTDVKGETAIGFDDRARRIAVGRKRTQPRTQVYSFAHIVSAEVVQNGVVVARVASESGLGESPAGDETTEGSPPGEEPGSLFGSTSRPAPGAAPELRPLPGQLTALAVRVALREGADRGVLVRFYEGKGVDVRSVAGEGALARAQTCLGALDIAMKRAGMPPRPATSVSGLGPRT